MDIAQDLERLAGVLHTLSCPKPHAQQMEELLTKKRNPNLCYYYLEEALSEDSLRPDHDTWLAAAERVCQERNLTPGDLLRIIPSLLECRQKLNLIYEKCPNAEEFCRLVLFS